MNKIELIDRTEVIEALEFSKTIRHMQDNVPLIDEFIGILNDAPLIDAAPVRRGEWKDESECPDIWPGDALRCTACGKLANDYIGGTEDAYFVEDPNFCPNCGADMRRVSE